VAEEILVEEVSDNRRKVFLRVMNVRFVFIRKPGGGIKLVSKIKPGAQVHDPDACWVPDHMFRAAYRQAAAILNVTRRKRQMEERQ